MGTYEVCTKRKLNTALLTILIRKNLPRSTHNTRNQQSRKDNLQNPNTPRVKLANLVNVLFYIVVQRDFTRRGAMAAYVELSGLDAEEGDEEDDGIGVEADLQSELCLCHGWG